MPLRVLYIDDDRINSLLFEETCRVAGDIDLEVAGCGREACEVVQPFSPELLVIDLHLPDTNGFALLAELRRLTGQPALPAFLCTADEGEDVARRSREAGFAGLWTKPVRLDQVREALSRRRAGGATHA